MAYGYKNQSNTWYFETKEEAMGFGSTVLYNESYMVGYNKDKRMWFVTIFGRRSES